jgi:hypothetical protein
MVAPFIGGNLPLTGGKIKSVFEDTRTHQIWCGNVHIFWWVIRQETDTDTARPRQYSIVEKRQAYLELSYLCSTFVLLWK